jgi:hypothetical protein
MTTQQEKYWSSLEADKKSKNLGKIGKEKIDPLIGAAVQKCGEVYVGQGTRALTLKEHKRYLTRKFPLGKQSIKEDHRIEWYEDNILH